MSYDVNGNFVPERGGGIVSAPNQGDYGGSTTYWDSDTKRWAVKGLGTLNPSVIYLDPKDHPEWDIYIPKSTKTGWMGQIDQTPPMMSSIYPISPTNSPTSPITTPVITDKPVKPSGNRPRPYGFKFNLDSMNIGGNSRPKKTDNQLAWETYDAAIKSWNSLHPVVTLSPVTPSPVSPIPRFSFPVQNPPWSVVVPQEQHGVSDGVYRGVPSHEYPEPIGWDQTSYGKVPVYAITNPDGSPVTPIIPNYPLGNITEPPVINMQAVGWGSSAPVISPTPVIAPPVMNMQAVGWGSSAPVISPTPVIAPPVINMNPASMQAVGWGSSPMKAMSGGTVGFMHKRKKIEKTIKNHRTRKNITG